MKYLLKLFLFFLLSSNLALADTKIVKVGLAAILSGDLAVFGTADLQAAKLYLENFSRHPIKLIPEDARLSSSEGLLAFQKLVNLDHVDVLIAAGTSNAIMAATSLIRNSKTVTLMASTAGKNINPAQFNFVKN